MKVREIAPLLKNGDVNVSFNMTAFSISVDDMITMEAYGDFKVASVEAFNDGDGKVHYEIAIATVPVRE